MNKLYSYDAKFSHEALSELGFEFVEANEKDGWVYQLNIQVERTLDGFPDKYHVIKTCEVCVTKQNKAFVTVYVENKNKKKIIERESFDGMYSFYRRLKQIKFWD